MHLTILAPDCNTNGGPNHEDVGETLTLQSKLVNPGDNFFVIVRPDMFIGFVKDEAGMDKYMSSIYAGRWRLTAGYVTYIHSRQKTT
jgi:hypothetical protein